MYQAAAGSDAAIPFWEPRVLKHPGFPNIAGWEIPTMNEDVLYLLLKRWWGFSSNGDLLVYQRVTAVGAVWTCGVSWGFEFFRKHSPESLKVEVGGFTFWEFTKNPQKGKVVC